MGRYIVTGGRPLKGEIRIQGAKNSVLPILAASVMNNGTVTVEDCPNIADVDITLQILRFLGCKVRREGNAVTIDASVISNCHIPQDLMKKMRSSVIFLGAILARCGKAKCSYPGGCELGARPINLHLKAFRQMGIDVRETHGYIVCKRKNFVPYKIQLDFPSVGATENIMLVAALSKGTTTIINAAREPEIVDLQDFLNRMGAKICGAGSSIITIEGVEKLHDTQKTVMPDRIVTATYLFAPLITTGDITLCNADVGHVESVVSAVKEMGAEVEADGSNLRVISRERPLTIDHIQTMPYPGFPTDAQSQLMAVLAYAKGTSIVQEKIFENRFRVAGEFIKMGADISVNERVAVVRGTKSLQGANVTAPDLRGGAGLVLAALGAQGVSEIEEIRHIERGYDGLDVHLRQLGADIRKVI